MKKTVQFIVGGFISSLLLSGSSCNSTDVVDNESTTPVTKYPESNEPCNKGFSVNFHDGINTWLEDEINKNNNRETKVTLYEEVATGKLYYDFMFDGGHEWGGTYTCDGDEANTIEVNQSGFTQIRSVYSNM